MACLQFGKPAKTTDENLDDFVSSFRAQLDVFVNRMKSNSSRGRPLSSDPSFQVLLMNVLTKHSQLISLIQEQEDTRIYYEGLQDKLSQVRDARAALEALREEEAVKKRLEAEEAERLRQQQLREKVDLMRQKKQEYLQYQRQLALQRMQEQELEMHLRQERSKQYYMQQGLNQQYFQNQQFFQTSMQTPLPQYQPYAHMTTPFQYAIPTEQAGNINVVQNLGAMPSHQNIVYGPVPTNMGAHLPQNFAPLSVQVGNTNQAPPAYFTSAFNNNRQEGALDLSTMSLSLPNADGGAPGDQGRSETTQQSNKSNSYQQELIALDL